MLLQFLHVELLLLLHNLLLDCRRGGRHHP
jgi:hypothetical protein